MFVLLTFDTVWRNPLLYKLAQKGVGGQFLRVIRNMYSSVLFAVKFPNGITDSFESTVGV